jgi:diaminopimelate epimerase
VIPFYRLSGAGNDFLVLAEPGEEPAAERIRAWCARGLSAGADGLIVLSRSGVAVRMVYFNSDGGRAALCINGTRCAALLAADLGWVGREVDILTDAGSIPAHIRAPHRVALELRPPKPPRPLDLEVDGDTHSGFLVDAGVPHFVLPWAGGLGTAPVAGLGPSLRSHPALGSAGANVDFARYPSPEHLELRSFERGVEAETLACGTGVLAVLAVGVATGLLKLPCEALTAGGFIFEIDGRAEGECLTRCTITGDARLIAKGELQPGAHQLPPPPRWAPAKLPDP